jgi:phosphatidate cytidylyltransferase
MLKTRVLTAIVLVPLVLSALFGLGARNWALVTLIAVCVAAGEWAMLADFSTQARWLYAGAAAGIGLALLLLPDFGFSAASGWPPAVVVAICGAATLFWICVVPAWVLRRWQVKSAAVLALVGALVLVATWVALVQIQARSPGLLLALMAIVWIADTAAYFAGRRFGKRKLAPLISPGKTWEGVYGALFAVGVYALALLPLARSNGYAQALGVGAIVAWVCLVLLLAGLSIFGDLFESLLKRQRGVKDSGKVLPGHGGVLDRIDALTAAMPAAALVAHYLIR